MAVLPLRRQVHQGVQAVQIPFVRVQQVGQVGAVATDHVFGGYADGGAAIRRLPLETAPVEFQAIEVPCVQFNARSLQEAFRGVRVAHVEAQRIVPCVGVARHRIEPRGRIIGWQVLAEARVQPHGGPEPVLHAQVVAMEMDPGFHAVVAVPPEVRSNEPFVCAPVGPVVQVVVEGDLGGEVQAVVRLVGIGEAVGGIDAHVGDAGGNVHARGVVALQVVPSDPPRQHRGTCSLGVPGIGDVVVVGAPIARRYVQVQRHLQGSLPAQADLLALASVAVPQSGHGVVDPFVGIDPLVEEPVQVHVRVLDDTVPEVLDVRMADAPLLEVVAHGLGEEFIAQHVLQVVEHHGGLVVHVPVSALALAFVVPELVAVRVDRWQAVAHGIAHVPCVHLLFHGQLGFGVAPGIGPGRRVVHERVSVDVHQARSGEVLREPFIEHGAVGLVVADHAEEPVVPHFVHEEAAVVRFTPAVQRQHGVFHAVPRIGHHHFRIGVEADPGTVALDHLRAIVRRVLPAAGVRLLRHADAADAVPFRLADAVRGIGGPGEIVHVLRMVAPHFAHGAVVRCDHARPFVPRFVLEVADVQFRTQVGRQHVLRVLQPARGFQHLVVGHVQFHVVSAEIAVELIAQMLLRVPAHLAIVHADPGVPLGAVVVLVAPGGEELHAAPHAFGPMRLEHDPECGLRTGGQRHRQPGFQHGVVLLPLQFDPVHAQRKHLGAAFLAVAPGCAAVLHQVGVAARVVGVLVQVEVDEGQGVRRVVPVGQGRFAFADVRALIEAQLDAVVHVLLPVPGHGRTVLPVVGVVRVAVGVRRVQRVVALGEQAGLHGEQEADGKDPSHEGRWRPMKACDQDIPLQLAAAARVARSCSLFSRCARAMLVFSSKPMSRAIMLK